MNWIPVALLAEISDDINSSWTHKRSKMHDIDISEDYLSIELVQTLREDLAIPRMDRREPNAKNGFHLSVQAYKATGGLERVYGDIAIIISDCDRRTVGTGFYEAKLQSIDGSYPAFKMRQIQRLESSTPRLAIMMHERRQEPVNDNPFDRNVPEDDNSSFNDNHSFCRALPASWARKFKRLSDAAYQRRPYSFGYHFVTRYLLGTDLDYSRSPAKAINRWKRITKGFPLVVVEIKISKSEDGLLRYESILIPPGSPQTFLPLINQIKRLDQPEFIPII